MECIILGIERAGCDWVIFTFTFHRKRNKWSRRQNNGNRPIRIADKKADEDIKNESNIWSLKDNIMCQSMYLRNSRRSKEN